MPDVTIVIPNYNGMAVLDTCLRSVLAQKGVTAQVIVVDNGSTDGSQEFTGRNFPTCELVCLDRNYGFSRAVNEGFRRAKSRYVILLNNDTEAEPDFAARLLAAIRRHKKCFSCQACMLQYQDRERLDSAGDLYCALGWAFSRGKGKSADTYPKGGRIFSSCAGAAIYRRDVVERLGGFDEAHFVYLEDVDICWRARLAGYENRYEPRARVYHIGSASSGSRHNSFKVGYAAGNSVYLIYKNMPLPQILLNAPFLLAGYLIKYLYFVKKGFGGDYRRGIRRGITLCGANRDRRFSFRAEHIPVCARLQLELWRNILRLPS